MSEREKTSLVKGEIYAILNALSFFTRIPIPKKIPISEQYLRKASKYFPLIGWIVGGVSALVFLLSNMIMPALLSILLSIVSSILLTGAIHEDGLADFADGFWGGYSKSDTLRIMKDSQIGVFGVISLIVIFALKFVCLFLISPLILPILLIVSHSFSRFSSTIIMFTLDYVREEENSKSKPLVKKSGFGALMLSLLFGVLPFFLFNNYWYFTLVIPVVITTLILRFLFKKKIGGYTGDCLGATQQLNEIVIYIFAVVEIWKYF